MAKKKDKPQIINNIQELNLEIDYEKLAEAIVKAQNQSSTIDSYSEDDHEYIIKTILGKIKNNYLSFTLSSLISRLFYVLSFGEIFITAHFLPNVYDGSYDYFLSQDNSIWISRTTSIMAVIVYCMVSFFICCILINIAREVKKENDRNFVISIFSGLVSFAALVVALVALFKGVG